jgi:succinyl-diaminopimelate desuccinylase
MASFIGRGAVDMKGGVAAMIAASARFLDRHGPEFGGRLSFILTGDEEGPAINGTDPLMKHIDQKGERIDACLLGEPTNPETMGEMIKVGRRGSLTATLSVEGVQGHVPILIWPPTRLTRWSWPLPRSKSRWIKAPTFFNRPTWSR